MRPSWYAYQSTLLGWLVGFFAFLAQAPPKVEPPVVKFWQVTPADLRKQPVPVDTSLDLTS